MDYEKKLLEAADGHVGEPTESVEVPKKWLDQFAILVKNNTLLQEKVTDLEHFAERMSEAAQEMSLKLQKVESDQGLLDWKVKKLLSALDPEGCPDPGPHPNPADTGETHH